MQIILSHMRTHHTHAHTRTQSTTVTTRTETLLWKPPKQRICWQFCFW